MSNLNTLNQLLFAQLENLTDKSLTSKELKKEIDKSKAVATVATQLVRSADLQLKADQLYGSSQKPHSNTPTVFSIEHDDEG